MTGVQVAENFFPMLGVEPAVGRLFTPEECRKGGRAAVLLSHQFWQRQFGGDPVDRRAGDPDRRGARRYQRGR